MWLVLAALVIGLSLGIFGSGGAILTLPVMLYLLDQPPKLAIASSLLVVALVTFATSVFNWRKQKPSLRHVWLLGIPGIVGSYLGAWSSVWVDARVQLIVFTLLLFIAASLMWKKSSSVHMQRPTHAAKSQILVLQGAILGAVTGFVGVGGGFLIVPALTLMAGLGFVEAVSTSMVLIALQSSVAFAKHYYLLNQLHEHLDWQPVLIVSVVAVITSISGNLLLKHLPTQLLGKLFSVFLALIALGIGYQQL